jgi:protein-S-isoprenylcysteine O-methyltransferase Ste14
MDKKTDIIIFLLEIIVILLMILVIHFAWSIIKIVLVFVLFCLLAIVIINIVRTIALKIFRDRLFALRSYTPIPFLLAMIIFAQPTSMTMAIGFVVAAAGECIRFWSVAYAGSLTRVTGSVGAPEVIVAGPFSHVRNPLYVGNMLTYVGIGIMSNARFPWLVLGAAVWFGFQYYQIVMLEESFLEKEFGATYLEFKSHVPRFIPSLSAYVNPIQSKQLPNWKEATNSERRTFQAISIVFVILIVLWYAR